MSVPLLNGSGCLDALTAPDVARQLDGFVTKTITPLPREGNPPPRIAETEYGMLNSIGLQGPGIGAFVADVLPRLAALEVPLWVSVGGFSTTDFAHVCARLDEHDAVDTIELNLSCPNVDEAPETSAELVAAARAVTSKRLFAKLSPASSNIAEAARAVVASGADGLTLVNTIRGLALDPRTLSPTLARAVGGYSGPALKPIAPRVRVRVCPGGRCAGRGTGWCTQRTRRSRARCGGRKCCRAWHRPLRRSRRSDANPCRAGDRGWPSRVPSSE